LCQFPNKAGRWKLMLSTKTINWFQKYCNEIYFYVWLFSLLPFFLNFFEGEKIVLHNGQSKLYKLILNFLVLFSLIILLHFPLHKKAKPYWVECHHWLLIVPQKRSTYNTEIKETICKKKMRSILNQPRRVIQLRKN
jgi:hypothetical protein